MGSRFIDWIWNIRGSLALAPGQSSKDVFDRLDPLFRETGTSHDRTNDTLIFSKKDPAAQDKMSVFDRGVLRIERGAEGAVLRYRLSSRALLFCFLAPLLFLAFGQMTVALGNLDKPSSEAADASKKKPGEDAVPQLNPIDQALGAPAPEKPKKDEPEKGPTPTSAYVFAAIFAVLYAVGRILEDRLIKARFKKRLLGL